MTPRLALIIGAAAAFVFGLGLLVFPSSMLSGSGLPVTKEAVAASRGAGATLIGLGVINWSLRNATTEVVRALLVGNLVIQALSLLVNLGGAIVGELPFQAAGASLVHIALGAVFVLAMRPPR